ncbi:MAG: hypothetical protein Q7R70_00075 [Candidatus Diapherotrites archaeon]|nr:hypothetical protein [Candidatus Diapherotrites archaeon]
MRFERRKIPVITQMKTAKPISLQEFLGREFSPTAPSGEIGAAFNSFARHRISSRNRIISRQELAQIVGKFGKNAITSLMRRGLKIEKAQRKGRIAPMTHYRKLDQTDGVKPVNQAIAATEMKMKAGKVLRENPGLNADYTLHSAWRKRKK